MATRGIFAPILRAQRDARLSRWREFDEKCAMNEQKDRDTILFQLL